MKCKYIIGIDEVGRGCLAGPITVAAVAIPPNLRFKNLKDSKKLTAEQRQKWLHYIKNQHQIFSARANVRPATIDRINISKAANLAATRALRKLVFNFKLPLSKVNVLLDGGLFLNFDPPNTKTVIKGDEKYNAIKLASIVAKVSRDRLMNRYHQKFPHYDFDEHKGYGTKKHISAIKQQGICELHRLTFLKNFARVFNVSS